MPARPSVHMRLIDDTPGPWPKTWPINPPRHHHRNFTGPFADLVERGYKMQTIRAEPKRPADWPCPGDLVTCTTWSGKPYRKGSTKRTIGGGVITRVWTITIVQARPGCDRHVRIGDENILNSSEVGAIALQDGFPSQDAFYAYFRTRTGTFRGPLIQWAPVGQPCPHCHRPLPTLTTDSAEAIIFLHTLACPPPTS